MALILDKIDLVISAFFSVFSPLPDIFVLAFGVLLAFGIYINFFSEKGNWKESLIESAAHPIKLLFLGLILLYIFLQLMQPIAFFIVFFWSTFTNLNLAMVPLAVSSNILQILLLVVPSLYFAFWTINYPKPVSSRNHKYWETFFKRFLNGLLIVILIWILFWALLWRDELFHSVFQEALFKILVSLLIAFIALLVFAEGFVGNLKKRTFQKNCSKDLGSFFKSKRNAILLLFGAFVVLFIFFPPIAFPKTHPLGLNQVSTDVELQQLLEPDRSLVILYPESVSATFEKSYVSTRGFFGTVFFRSSGELEENFVLKYTSTPAIEPYDSAAFSCRPVNYSVLDHVKTLQSQIENGSKRSELYNAEINKIKDLNLLWTKFGNADYCSITQPFSGDLSVIQTYKVQYKYGTKNEREQVANFVPDLTYLYDGNCNLKLKYKTKNSIRTTVKLRVSNTFYLLKNGTLDNGLTNGIFVSSDSTENYNQVIIIFNDFSNRVTSMTGLINLSSLCEVVEPKAAG